MQAAFPDPPGTASPSEGDVATADGRLGYTQAGTAPHPILLLHGWPQTSHAWRRVQPLLAARWTTVALDLRGVGRSSPQAHGYDKATMAADVHTAKRNLGLDRPALVGHDMGALVAYAFARQYWSPGNFVDISIMLLLVSNCQIGARNPLGLSCRADVVSGRDCNIARCSRTRRS